MNTPETINIEKYAHALNNLIGVDSAYFQGDKDVDAIVEVIVAAKKLENRVKELAEENEYLKQQNEIYETLNKKLEDACESYAWTYGTAVSKELFLKKERENAVREMQKRLTDYDEFLIRADYDGIYYIDHACWVNQVAAEILGEE